MTANPLGFSGRTHRTARTRHGWSKALQLPPDLYPGVGGKRFRAALLQRAYEFAGGSGSAPAGISDAVEMLHAGSLVIDDFEDDSLTRRGQPALHRVVGPARAVNAGNWMYFRALELASTACESPARSAALLGRFIEVARQCHEGQAIDLATRVDEVSPRQAYATALAISRWKTGRLVSLAAWCGAHAAGDDTATLRAAAAFGCRVGICLQMKNDLDELRELLGVKPLRRPEEPACDLALGLGGERPAPPAVRCVQTAAAAPAGSPPAGRRSARGDAGTGRGCDQHTTRPGHSPACRCDGIGPRHPPACGTV